jgi:hypothetical protein
MQGYLHGSHVIVTLFGCRIAQFVLQLWYYKYNELVAHVKHPVELQVLQG